MIRWNEERYRFVFQSRGGTVGRFMGRTAVQLENAGKLIATQEKLVRTGRYRASITARLVNDARGLVVKFGSPVPYARILERGSPSHQIPFVAGQPWLYWNRPNDRGWMVTPPGNRPIRSVNHPGTDPYLVLRRAILLVTKGGIAR